VRAEILIRFFIPVPPLPLGPLCCEETRLAVKRQMFLDIAAQLSSKASLTRAGRSAMCGENTGTDSVESDYP
jgi:hypothetical protein